MKIFYIYENESNTELHDKLFSNNKRTNGTISICMAQHMGKCSLEIQNNKTFKYILKVNLEKSINLRKKNNIFEVKKSAIENLLIAYIKNWSKYKKLK